MNLSTYIRSKKNYRKHLLETKHIWEKMDITGKGHRSSTDKDRIPGGQSIRVRTSGNNLLSLKGTEGADEKRNEVGVQGRKGSEVKVGDSDPMLVC